MGNYIRVLTMQLAILTAIVSQQGPADFASCMWYVRRISDQPALLAVHYMC